MISKENEKYIQLQKQQLAIQRKIESDAIQQFKPLLKNYKGPEKIDTKITEEMVKDYEEEKRKPIEVDGKLYKNNPLLDDLDLEDYEPPVAVEDIEDAEIIDEYKERVNEIKNAISDYDFRLKSKIQENQDIINELKPKIKESKNKTSRNRMIKQVETAESKIATFNEQLLDTNPKKVELFDEIKLLNDKINLNNEKVTKNYEEKQRINNINEERRKQRINTIQILNTGRFDMRREPNESTEAYLKRLEDQTKIEVNEDILKQEAEIENIKRLKNNLKDIVRIESRIENIVKSFSSSDDVYLLNTNWPKIRKVYLENYGVNNKLTASEIVAILITMLDDLKKNGLTDLLTKVKSENLSPDVVKELVSETTVDNELGLETFNDLTINYDNFLKALIINHNGVDVYLKIITKGVGTKELKYLSVAYEPDNGGNGKYLLIRYSKGGGALKKLVADPLGIDLERLRLNLGIPKIYMYTVKAIPYIINKFPELGQGSLGSAKIIDPANKIWGFGINKLPEMCKFGNIFINIDKLYHKNILSVFNQNKNKILGFPNTRVSDAFVSLIMKLCKNEHVTPRDINNIHTGEKEVYDQLLYISKLNKDIKSGTGTETIEKLKHRFQLLEGQINAGNNNTDLLSELYKILTKMVNFNLISQSEFKRYYKQVEKKINL